MNKNMSISDPVIFVTCNRCGYEEQFNQTLLNKSDWYKNLVDILISKGWTIDRLDFCPECTIFQIRNK